MADRLTFALKDWRGPSGVTLIQGVKWDGSRFLIGQADDVGTAVEDVVLREHAADLSYTGRSQTLKQAGHGSSFGVEAVAGGTRVWIGHKLLGVGYYLFGESLFTPTPGVPNGDVAVDQANDLLCVRVGNRYRGYSLSAVENGKPVTLFDQSIPAWGKRFQGHSITRLSDGNVYVLVHRDVKTLGESRADWFKCLNGKLYAAGSINTTKMGDEAEGFLLYDGSVWITKRHGGNNAGRTVLATRTHLKLLKNEVDTMATSQNGWTAASSANGIPGGTKRIVPKGAPDSAFTVRAGDVATVFQYLVDQYQARVEDIDLYTKGSGDDWGFAPRPVRGSSRTLSNHASATAIDINATRHPLGVGGSMGFSAKQLSEIRKILKELRGSVRWGGNYSGRKDGMHFEINTSASRLKSVAADIRSGKIGGRVGIPTKIVDKVVSIIQPRPVKHQPLISLKAVQAAIRSGASLTVGVDGKQYQTMLNRFNPVYKLKVDGVLGQNSRRATALAQLKVAQSNGNKSLNKDDAWPNKGHHADLDGLPGGELFKAMGIDNSDDNAVKA